MERITLYSISYYKKNMFRGSYRGMNFHIQKGGSDEEPVLVAQAWKGPYILEKTEEEVVTGEFPFSDEGLAAADAWLESEQKILCL